MNPMSEQDLLDMGNPNSEKYFLNYVKPLTTVYHYTKIDTIEKMFLGNNKGIRLRLSDFRELNDASESFLFRKLIVKNKDKLKNSLKTERIKPCLDSIDLENIENDIFVFSMTEIEDSFIFWNSEYAGRDGVSIEIDVERLQKSLTPFLSKYRLGLPPLCSINYINPNDEIFSDDSIFFMGDLLDKSFGTKIAYNFSLDQMTKMIERVLSYCSIGYKYIPWNHECEHRIILSKDMQIVPSSISLETKIECVGNKLKKVLYVDCPINFVGKIIFGPNCKTDIMEYVGKYLNKIGYGNIITFDKSQASDFHKDFGKK
jgi:hypothetical protein